MNDFQGCLERENMKWLIMQRSIDGRQRASTRDGDSRQLRLLRSGREVDSPSGQVGKSLAPRGAASLGGD